ncbi:MAG TPA: alpha/beta hydrolase [Thermoanaerobaculia bacterium]|nr:alpha/beta hydrolase [Thermoanaerobaculia bacterium]
MANPSLAVGLTLTAPLWLGTLSWSSLPGSPPSPVPAAGTVVAPASGPLAVRSIGHGRPAVVLLHGLFGSHRYWRGYDGLAARHRLIVPDLLGFGDSPKPATGYSADDHALAVAGTLEGLGVVEPAVVVAHSAGTVVALRLRALRPDLVAGVVAFGPPLYGSQQQARHHLRRLDPLAGLFVQRGALARGLCHWFHRHPRLALRLTRWTRRGLPPEVVEDTLAHTWDSFRYTLEGLLLSAEAEGWLATTDSPIRLVAGDSDRVVDVAYLRDLERRRPGISIEIVPGGGHHLPLTHPALTRTEIERALAAAGTRLAAPDRERSRK